MRVSSQSISFFRLVAPICIGGGLAAAAACAPPQDDFDDTTGNVTPQPTAAAPASSAPVAVTSGPGVQPVPGVPVVSSPAATTGAPSSPGGASAVVPGTPSVQPTTGGVAPPATGGGVTPPAATSAPAAATSAKPAGGTGPDIKADDKFWVSGGTNGVGIQGPWYEYKDTGGSTAAKTVEAGTVCVSGETTAVVVGEEGTTWGAGLGLGLNSTGTDKYDVWDGSKYSGFAFTAAITGSDTVTLEFVEKGFPSGDPPNEVAVKNGANTIKFSAAEQPSWFTDAATPLDESKLLKLQFKVAGGTAAETYKLCISAMKVTD